MFTGTRNGTAQKLASTDPSGEYSPPRTFCDAARKARQLSAMIAWGSPLLTIETRAATRQLLLTGASDPLLSLLLPGDARGRMAGPAGFPVSSAAVTTRRVPYATAQPASCSAWLKDLAAVKHLRRGGRGAEHERVGQEQGIVMEFIRGIPKHRSAKLPSMLKPCKAKHSETPSYPALPLVAPHVEAVHG